MSDYLSKLITDREIFHLFYSKLGSISLIVWKLCAFRQRSNLDNFKQCFHHNFRLKRKFWNLMVSFGMISSDLSEYAIFKLLFFSLIKINFEVKNETFYVFSSSFYKLLSKFSDFLNSNDCIGKLTSKYNEIYPVFI